MQQQTTVSQQTSHSFQSSLAPQAASARQTCAPQWVNQTQASIQLPSIPKLPPILQRHANPATQGALSPCSGVPFRRRRTDQPAFLAQRGFTLIELMLVIAIAAILCAVSFPSFSSVIASSRSRTASNALITGLNLARSTAVSRQGDVVMCPSSDANHCDATTWWQYGWIVFQDLNHNSQRDAGEPVLTVAQLQTGIAIATTAGREHVTYRGEGTSSGTNLTFTLCDRRGPKHASTVVVSNPGRPLTSPAMPAEAATACAGL
jgi:type IV fimbrial biogenesis protein FimT